MIYWEIVFYLRDVWWRNFGVTCGSCRVQREEDKCLPIKKNGDKCQFKEGARWHE